MAPRKNTTKVSAGAGKTTKSPIKKRASTKASTSPAPAFLLDQTASPSLEGLEVIQRKPRIASAPEVVQKKPSTKTKTKSTVLKDPTITKSSLRNKTVNSVSVTSSPVKSSDSEPDTLEQRKLAAFDETRGLSFDQLHVQSAEFDDGAHHSGPSEKQTPQQTPQKNSKKAVKATRAIKTIETSSPKMITTVDETKASTSKMPTTVDETKVSAVSTRASRKRGRGNDDNEVSQGSPVAPASKIVLKSSEGSPSTSIEQDTSKVAATLPPAKRLKIHAPPAPLAPAAATPAPVTTTPANATAGKGKTVITKNGKVKKTPEYAVEHAFIGTPSNHGSSLERPQFASLDEPWCCANLNCSTGMTWVPRDHKDPQTGKGPMGRKVISQFFGRNKGPTKLIPNDVWHYFCRKDYQRSRYAAEHGTATELATQVITNLRDQLIRLKLWRPDALFQVQLDKGATDRLNKYLALLRQHGNNEAAAAAALPAPKDLKKVKPEEAFPCSLSEVFNQRFATLGKDATATYDDIENLITWSENEITAGNSTVFVPAEFLINPIQPDETVNDVTDNFANWEVIRAAIIAGTLTATGAPTTLPPAPMATKASKLRETPITDPDETEAEEGDNDSEPATPTPAPRFRVGSEDPMSIMRLLNDEAEDMGYDARRSRSSSN
jgi:hypothetical protein